MVVWLLLAHIIMNGVTFGSSAGFGEGILRIVKSMDACRETPWVGLRWP
jgi:hypothetical protein